MRYRINHPQVIHETIDGETVVVDLSNGTYYSLEGPGVEILDLLASGLGAAAVVDRLTGRWEGDRDAMERAVTDFAGELARAGIIVPAPDADVGGAADSPPGAEASRRPFTSPVLNRYTDMQELLLLDPIHEVGEAGWPERKPEDRSSEG